MKILLKLLFILIPFCVFPASDFCVLTVPKCGTHLILEIVKDITHKKFVAGADFNENDDPDFLNNIENEKKFVVTHKMSDWQLNQFLERGYKFIYLYRDPRDHLISYMYWLPNMTEDQYPAKVMKIGSDLIQELIDGKIYGKTAYEYMYCYGVDISKIPEERVIKIRFEDIVGSQGGGSSEIQALRIKEIADFIDYNISFEESQTIGKQCWGRQGIFITFRKGIIGDWKNYFTEEHIRSYKERYGQVLIDLGYEKDLNW